MKISRQIRRFHDPWGTGNNNGSVTDEQWRVCKGMGPGSRPDRSRWRIDTVTYYERINFAYIRGGKSSVEKIRR